MFLLTTALAVWLVLQRMAARQQQIAVEIVRKYHGNVYYDFNERNRNGRPAPWRAWLGRWIGNDYVFTVVGVGLSGHEVDDDVVKLISCLAKLRQITLVQY